MKVITVDNVNQALREFVSLARNWPAQWRDIAPRGGQRTIEYVEPVATVYLSPWRRVLFSATRDANPFFHLMECLWMLSGRKDAEWISQFNSNIGNYAEDDGHFHGAYGHRWRYHFDRDQLDALVYLLKNEPDTRRAVLGMWDPRTDLNAAKRDLPCNTHVYFKIREKKLHMLVSCRSNDVIWGCYGANAVHFSFLQEYVATRLGVTMGPYTHVSDSWHYYVDNPFAKMVLSDWEITVNDYYVVGGPNARVGCLSIINTPIEMWEKDLATFMSDDWRPYAGYQDTFFRGVALLMREAWNCYLGDRWEDAMMLASQIVAPDWKRATTTWLQMRRKS